ncbi:putative RNA-binding protein 15B [Corythoichthys intestinalis]|uniref:putative RNA-binding protein 15B n=1 Tax=Corythoichthys intestinalis TaxID=161448 RepID=UPI0025A56EF2|nr:putative RNA-binding protein 15B [Corythoichthys intestinalis]XP_061814484.1 putative RNA-binding protein 15B [Nerophis lumbriciformis]
MKRQAARESSPPPPPRAAAKRLRERDRDRERERESVRRDELAPPLALLLADGRGHRRRSRSREREREREKAAVSAAAVAAGLRAPAAAGLRAPARDYKTLLISNVGPQVPDDDLEDALFHEFKRFGDVSVKLSHTPEMGRIAYVNFRHAEDAKEARRAKSTSRLLLAERPLKIEPVYVRRRSVTPPDPGYLAAAQAHYPPYRQRSLSPPAPSLSLRELRARHYALESLSRERLLDYYGMLDERGRPYGLAPTPPLLPPPPPDDLKPEDDQRATSNLFIGNLDGGVTEVELRRGFEKYGTIEDVVIKRPARGQGGAYAFVKFQNLDMAHRAKVAMQGRLVGGHPVKIGYGKANPTTRLWVGGLGPTNSLPALAREFDRFGSIRNIDYVKGDSFAYVQYESLDAAQAACTQMRGFHLGGAERRLRVDFAKVEESAGRPFTLAQPPPPPHYESPGEAYGRRRASLERRASPSFAPSPPRGVQERRSAAAAEAFGRRGRSRSRERWPKEREEKRARRGRSRSLSAEREKARGRPRASPELSVRAPDSTTEPRDHTPDAREAESPPARQRKPAESHRRGGEAAVRASPPPPPAGGSLSEFAAAALPKSWRGVFALKNSSFPAQLYLLEGGAPFFGAIMRRNGEPLKIAQRLRMDQSRLDEVARRIKAGRPDAFAVLLALQGPATAPRPAAPEGGPQVRLLRHLVAYLRNKEAAGVVSLPGAMLYAFPPGDFSLRFLQAAKKAATRLDEEHMVVVVVNDTN